MMGRELPLLPVSDRLDELAEALAGGGSAVLVAPPGAGKTTLVPLALLDAPWRGDGMILLLEPRRIAARAAAARMASLLGEEPGQTVGYRTRLDSKVSAKTRILVVTEGVFPRMALDDPELAGITAVIFDEFHERSLDADFGLALALDIRSGLRPDLKLLVMSATMDGAKVAGLLGGAQVVESLGRSFPVEIRYHQKRADERIEEAVCRETLNALSTLNGDALVFLPGTREINWVASLLTERAGPQIVIAPLHGSLSAAEQDSAIRPPKPGSRKVVLATSVAETSITIEGVTIVIDAGLQRLPKFHPGSGLTRLETVPASKASSDQRAGRAGRTAPGTCIRLWRKEQNAARPDITPPGILEADLSSLVLDAATFGISDLAQLRFIDPPPAPALNEARQLLRQLGALDGDGRITKAGDDMRKIALPVRLAHMVAGAGDAKAAAEIAVLLTERGLGGNDADLDVRWSNFRRDRGAGAAHRLAENIAASAGGKKGADKRFSAAELLIHAYPDHIAKARGRPGQFLLANGSGAELDPLHPLAGKPWLVIADMQGSAERMRILSAAELDEGAIADLIPDAVETVEESVFDPARRALRRQKLTRIGAIVLSTQTLPPPSGEAADRAMIAAVREHGLEILAMPKEADELRKRLSWLHKGLGEPWPDMSDAALIERLDEWLAPWLSGIANLSKFPAQGFAQGLRALVPADLQRKIDDLAPTHYAVPSGSSIPINYAGDELVLSVRVQELFGLKAHPAIAGGRVPLLLELLSPAHRTIQLTRDLPGFWKGSWAEVRSQMRGRYPKHVWPEDPENAAATSRAKPRGQ